MHGHNYRCQLTLAGERLDHTGLLMDFVELKRALMSVIDRLDHQWLNDFPPFDVLNPSAENIAKFIYDEVRLGIPNSDDVRIESVRLWETDTSSATYRP